MQVLKRKLTAINNRYIDLFDHSPYWHYLRCRRVIYIHVPKTGGTSILHTLSASPKREHLLWSDYYYADKRKFKRYFKFATVRHPRHRLAAFYYYMLAGGNQMEDKLWQKFLAEKYPTFESFVLEFMSSPKATYRHRLLWQQSLFIYDQQDRLMVDQLLRMEKLSIEFNTWQHKIKPKFPLPRLNTSDSNHYGHDYSSLYSPAMIAIVNQLYHRDIKLLGYY